VVGEGFPLPETQGGSVDVGQDEWRVAPGMKVWGQRDKVAGANAKEQGFCIWSWKKLDIGWF